MTPKEKRERLFRHSRPRLREFEFYDGDEYHKDIKLAWVAHKIKPFYGISSDIDQSEFARVITSMDAEILMAEDENRQYKGVGPVGICVMYHNGWKVEPHSFYFPWATSRNILRSSVAYLQWARNSRKIGCVYLAVVPDGKSLYDHICSYGVLHYIGRLINGDPRGDVFIYSVKGKKRKV